MSKLHSGPVAQLGCMVFSSGYGMVFSFGHGLFIWAWSFHLCHLHMHLGMVFSFAYGLHMVFSFDRVNIWDMEQKIKGHGETSRDT